MCTFLSSQNTQWNGNENGFVLFYHPYSFYSQKVLIALHEKKLLFRPHVVDLLSGEQFQPWFLKVNPKGEVPVLKDGIKIIPDSTRIIDYLDDNFSNGDTPRLTPLSQGSQKVIYFRSLIDQLPAGAITMGALYHSNLCENQKPPFIQPMRRALQNSERKIITNLQKRAHEDPNNRELLLEKVKSRDVKHQHLSNKDEFEKLLQQVDAVLSEVETELGSHFEDKRLWWLCGEQFTTADVSLTVLLDRLYRLGLENYFWANKKPNIAHYYSRVQQRDSYKNNIPSIFVLIKTLLQIQTPFVLGMAIVGCFTLILGACFLLKKKGLHYLSATKHV